MASIDRKNPLAEVINEDVETGPVEVNNVPQTNGRRRPSAPLRSLAESTLMERLAGAVALAAVGTSVAAMVVEQTAIVVIAGLFSSGIGPYAYWQQTRLTDIAALKETHAAVQKEVDKLQAENARLHDSIDDLSQTVERLDDVEQALQEITRLQGQNVREFANQVQENREILTQMQKNLKANVLQNLLSVIIRNDANGDSRIDDRELENLITHIQSINGIQLHEDRFRKAIIANGRSLQAVMDVIKNLLSDSTPEEDKIFTIIN